MKDCIFCKIVAGELPARTIYEDDKIMAFHDLHPKAKVHVLVIPKLHIKSFLDVSVEHCELMGHCTVKLKEIALLLGLENGFRTVINTGKDGGQEIDHLHYHILGGGVLPKV